KAGGERRAARNRPSRCGILRQTAGGQSEGSMRTANGRPEERPVKRPEKRPVKRPDKQHGDVDPVTLEIVRGALRAIQGEMEAGIERTAMSPSIREKKDFYAALFDAAGRLIIGSNLPVFGDVVGPVAEHYPLADMRPGDIYWFNDCYASKGAVSHSPDQVFLAPVFAEGRLSAFAQSWAHFNDIGGMPAGSLSPDCTEIFHDGIILPPVRVSRARRR